MESFCDQYFNRTIYMPNALITLFNKDGIEELAGPLHQLGWKIYGSEGTVRVLHDLHGIPATDIATVVGAGPSKGHLVVTLSREVALGLLTPDTPEDREGLDVPFFDLYCANFYPLLRTVAQEDVDPAEVFQNTDIGGPNNARAAAKGRRYVIVDPADYGIVARHLSVPIPGEEENLKHALMVKALAACAQYDLASAMYHSDGRYYGQVLEACSGRISPFELGTPIW